MPGSDLTFLSLDAFRAQAVRNKAAAAIVTAFPQCPKNTWIAGGFRKDGAGAYTGWTGAMGRLNSSGLEPDFPWRWQAMDGIMGRIDNLGGCSRQSKINRF